MPFLKKCDRCNRNSLGHHKSCMHCGKKFSESLSSDREQSKALKFKDDALTARRLEITHYIELIEALDGDELGGVVASVFDFRMYRDGYHLTAAAPGLG